MKKVETVYKGTRFESRLEARWAFFFDALGLNWEYKPGVYKPKGKEWYIPDFAIRSESTTSKYEPMNPNNMPPDSDHVRCDQLVSIRRRDYVIPHTEIDKIHSVRNAGEVIVICGDPLDFEAVTVIGFGGSRGYSKSINQLVVCPRCGILICDRGVLSSPRTYENLTPMMDMFCGDCDQETPSGHDNEIPPNEILTSFCGSVVMHTGVIITDYERYKAWFMNAANESRRAFFGHGNNS